MIETITRLVTAQCGTFAVAITYATSSSAGKRSNSRWAKTVPTSVPLEPRPRGTWRRSTATRASSPIRPGSTAFPSSPTENAEKTWSKRGCGGSSAWLIVSCQAIERRSTEKRFSPSANAIQAQLTRSNAW